MEQQKNNNNRLQRTEHGVHKLTRETCLFGVSGTGWISERCCGVKFVTPRPPLCASEEHNFQNIVAQRSIKCGCFEDSAGRDRTVIWSIAEIMRQYGKTIQTHMGIRTGCPAWSCTGVMIITVVSIYKLNGNNFSNLMKQLDRT